MKALIGFALLAVVLTVSSGCATLADTREALGGGTSKVYDEPFDRVWAAALESVRSSGLTLVSECKASGLILAERGVTAFSAGEYVAIRVEDNGEHGTRFEVVSKRVLATNIFAENWEPEIIRSVDARLASKYSLVPAAPSVGEACG